MTDMTEQKPTRLWVLFGFALRAVTVIIIGAIR
jgi:hypothetical protein